VNPEIFADWLRRQGHQVVRTESSYWFDQGPRVYQAFPYHWVITPSRHELFRFLMRNWAIGVRYSAPLTATGGSISYHCVYGKGSYNLIDLPRRARGAVRKGLRNLTVEQISLERLADEGWNLRLDTIQRQGRPKDEQQPWWRQLCLAASGLPGFEAWGAICRGKLVAALLAFTCDDCYTLLYQQSATQFLNSGANNALAYVVTHEAINRPGISQVFYGLQSLNASDDVDTFKVRMGYIATPLRQRVVFHPWLSPFFGQYMYRLTQRLVSRYPDKAALSKFEGMLHLFQNGKLPLDRQVHPPALAAYADATGTGPADSVEEDG
jgi:hypothetical protein